MTQLDSAFNWGQKVVGSNPVIPTKDVRVLNIANTMFKTLFVFTLLARIEVCFG